MNKWKKTTERAWNACSISPFSYEADRQGTATPSTHKMNVTLAFHFHAVNYTILSQNECTFIIVSLEWCYLRQSNLLKVFSFGHFKFALALPNLDTIEYTVPSMNDRRLFYFSRAKEENSKTIDKYFTYSCYNDHFVTSLTSFGPLQIEIMTFKCLRNVASELRDVGFVLCQ